MDKYLTLDLDKKKDAIFFAEKLFSDRPEWRNKRKQKERELESVRSLNAVSNSEVHSGNISKPTETMAFQAMKLEQDIERYENYEYIVEYGLSHISPEDREVLDAFYFTKGKLISAMVDELSHKYNCDPRTIYRNKRTAILNFVDAVRVIINY